MRAGITLARGGTVSRKALARKGHTDVKHFEPGKARANDAIRNARIELAARLGNVEALEREIDAKLDDQEDAVQWWRANVRQPGGKNGSHAVVADSATTLSVSGAEHILGFDKQTVSKWAKKLAKRDEYREAISRAARRKLQLEGAENHRAQGTGENEWWTPAKYVEAARSVLGVIDLDPASTPKANETIQAARFLTIADDGLAQEWSGRVWLNPPYAQPLIGRFIAKLLAEVSSNRVAQAIVLTHNYTDTAWFHDAANGAQDICFTRGRIGFLSPSGDVAAPTQGQAFFYFGCERAAFRKVFGAFGFIR